MTIDSKNAEIYEFRDSRTLPERRKGFLTNCLEMLGFAKKEIPAQQGERISVRSTVDGRRVEPEKNSLPEIIAANNGDEVSPLVLAPALRQKFLKDDEKHQCEMHLHENGILFLKQTDGVIDNLCINIAEPEQMPQNVLLTATSIARLKRILNFIENDVVEKQIETPVVLIAQKSKNSQNKLMA